MILRGGLILLIYVSAPFLLQAGNYRFTDTCKLAYHAIISLKLTEANALLDSARTSHPNNLIPVLLEDYREFTALYLSQSNQAFETFSANQENRLDKLKNGDHNSPWHLYSQAEVNLHGAFAALMNQEYMNSFFAVRRAYKLLEQSQGRYPDFKPTQKSLALLKVLLGTIPQKYQWSLKIFGMSGQFNSGMSTLKELANESWLFQTEATFYYAMLLSHLEAKHSEAWQLMVDKGYPLSGNMMSYLVAADIAFYSKHNDAVIDIADRAPKGTEFAAIPLLQYFKGVAQVRRLDSAGIKTLQQFLAAANTGNYKASAYQYMAWWFLIQGDTMNYHKGMKEAQSIYAGKTEADKMAYAEAIRGVLPNVILLKVRLLYDGGYYNRALEMLNGFDATKVNSEVKTEYLYRKGRLHDDMGQDSLALIAYDKTIALGAALPYYYAGNAALKAGEIYETQGNKTKAREYYNKCLSIKGHEYEDSLHQKARAGLERLN